MASAYAALLALARSLRDILDLQQHIHPLHKEKIVSLHEKVDFIVTFLEDHSDEYHETLGRVGNEIRKAAFEAQDFMDSYYCSVLTTDEDGSSSEANGDEVNLDRDLAMAFERIGFIWDEMMKMKMKNSDTAQDLRSVSYSSPVDRSSTVQATAKKMVVGFDADLIAIKERLYGDADELQIIPIVGMGGIGKTTLAKRVYEDSLFDQHFDIRAWITVSAEYQTRQILSGLLHDLEKRDREGYHVKSDAELKTLVYQNLKGRRYLIVVDDIWSLKAWDDFRMILPDDGNGSRILLTTRILNVAAHIGSFDTPIHQMNCLNEDQSWKLLQERVFGQQSCPLQLVTAGKKIAKNCGGLPLTIVVVAGLLLSSTGGIMNEELWEKVPEKISFREPTIALQCSKILCISYDRLPLRLKPCFLYIAAFPEDSQIDVSKLIKLWVAEGFLKADDQSKCLEDVGERYLEDLVNRSLLFVSSKEPEGKLKTVGIHDMLREICVTIAEEEGFLHNDSSSPRENPYRRLTCCANTNCLDTPNIEEPGVRTLLLLPTFHVRRSWLRRHLFILDAPMAKLTEDLGIISTCLNLRYLAFSLDDVYGSDNEYGYDEYETRIPYGFLVSISKHPSLETIVVFNTYRLQPTLPFEILMKPKLRHLIFDSFLLSYPSDIGIVQESDVQKLQTVVDLIFTEEIIKILVNLKKLRVKYYMKNRNWDDFNFENLVHLQNLEDLKLSVDFRSLIELDFDFSTPDPSIKWRIHAFPIGLKKLYLSGVPFPRESMSLIGSLPNLQMFRMDDVNPPGSSEWKTVEGQFLRLTYFRYGNSFLDDGWKTEKEHFPCLETLILEFEFGMKEIPRGIGEIDTLQYIELKCCAPSLVDSAKQIQRLQHENGNDAFRVRVIDYGGYNVLF